MVTKLDKSLRREIDIGGEPHVLTITPAGFVLTLKGRRKGLEIAWADLVSGEAALATALNASLTANVGARGERSEPAAPAAKRPTKAKPEPAKRPRRARTGSAR